MAIHPEYHTLSNGIPGVTVKLYHPQNGLVDTMITDQDGWYLSTYVHKGKEATYLVVLPGYAMSDSVTVGKSIKFGEVSFIIPPVSPSPANGIPTETEPAIKNHGSTTTHANQ